MTATPSTSGQPAPCTWWSDQWAWRGALAAAPLGALAAILYALIVLRTPPADALMAYLLGAALASGIACVLAGSLGGSVESMRHWLRMRSQAAETDGTDEAGHEPADAAYPDEPVHAEADAAYPDEPVHAEAEEHDDARPAHTVAA